jgi:hypothetical protein
MELGFIRPISFVYDVSYMDSALKILQAVFLLSFGKEDVALVFLMISSNNLY